jgi:heptosyltransferase-2
MKILIETPTWLGDAVMTTPAIQNIEILFPNSEIILIGSKLAIDILEGYGSKKIILNRSNNSPFARFNQIKQIAKSIGEIDISISFRKSFYSGLLQFLTKAKKRLAISSRANRIFINYPIQPHQNLHQVQRYLEIIKPLGEVKEFDLKLKFQAENLQKPTIGINSGATYGSAKRWHHKKFAELINKLPEEFDIILFGSPAEIEINNEIENLVKRPVLNLAGKTTIQNLAEKIAGLSFFITNDSGPLHIAGAFKIPTIAIFGSTDFHKTDQWQNPNQYIITKNLDCSPCMKRTCPLKHHNCMEQIQVNDILNIFYNIPKK